MKMKVFGYDDENFVFSTLQSVGHTTPGSRLPCAAHRSFRLYHVSRSSRNFVSPKVDIVL